jgi:acetyltransferase-like isoleucine patch superfamily enzyme
MSSLLLKIRRGDTPFYSGVKKRLRSAVSSTLPLPRFLHPLFRFFYSAQQNGFMGLRWLVSYFLWEPMFRARCESVGKKFRMWFLPFVVGHAKIYIGDNVNFFGKIDIFSGGLFEEPKLVVGNRVDLGHNVLFLVNKEIVLEDDVNVASGVRFMDTDAHPRDAMERIADLPPRPEEVKPVRIGRYAWIGHNSFIMKGVTIGEGAIIGVNSVVVNDIPPYCVAMGNPARVVVKNINQTAAAAPAAQSPTT